jgi:hypothetical protein
MDAFPLSPNIHTSVSLAFVSNTINLSPALLATKLHMHTEQVKLLLYISFLQKQRGEKIIVLGLRHGRYVLS